MRTTRLSDQQIKQCLKSGDRYLVLDCAARLHELDVNGVSRGAPIVIADLLAEKIEHFRTGSTLHERSVRLAAGSFQSRPHLYLDAHRNSRPKAPFQRVVAVIDLESVTMTCAAPVTREVIGTWGTGARALPRTRESIPTPRSELFWLAEDTVAYVSPDNIVSVRVSTLTQLATASIAIPTPHAFIHDAVAFNGLRTLVACGFGEYWQYTLRWFRASVSASGVALDFSHEHQSPSFTGDLLAIAFPPKGDELFGVVRYFEEKRTQLWHDHGKPERVPAGEVLRFIGQGSPDVLTLPDMRPLQSFDRSEGFTVPRMKWIPACEILRVAALSSDRVAVTSLDGKLYLADFAKGTVSQIETGLTGDVSCLQFFPDDCLVVGSECGEMCFIPCAELHGSER